jgi:2-polyprenyl-3-methyl-5-hydroxy-6-metoxy-1,4-benzoquinol methylase
MKTRESGMPTEEMWEEFFDPEATLQRMEIHAGMQTVLDFGCGYGTFSIPAARMIQGRVIGFDIDPEMIEHSQIAAAKVGVRNAQFILRDFVEQGTGLADGNADFVMLFNLLHAEDPHTLIREAWRNLAPEGVLAVSHWNHDTSTPRGPSMEIRPTPEDCRRWMTEGGFEVRPGTLDLPPWHYGLLGFKPAA